MRPECLTLVVLLVVRFVACYHFDEAFLNDQQVHCFKPHEYPPSPHPCVLGKLTIKAPLCGFSTAAEL